MRADAIRPSEIIRAEAGGLTPAPTHPSLLARSYINMQYAELHCHSAFSLLDGASLPEELVVAAKDLGLKALALTDHDDLGGIVRFAEAAKELNFPAIIGAEITLSDDSHLILLVEDIVGYKNLCYLISQSRSTSMRGLPKVSYESMANYSAGLIALSGCSHGAIPTNIASKNLSEAKRITELYKDIFADRFFIELWDHGLAQEAIICKELYNLAQYYSLLCVVTNNVHYASRRKRIIHDVLTCLKHGVTLSAAGRRLRPNDNWCLKSPQEMQEIWRDYPQLLQNTIRIAERCRFRLTSLKPSLPHFPTPDNLNHDQYLEQLVWEGAKRLYAPSNAAIPPRADLHPPLQFSPSSALRSRETLTAKHEQQIKHELAVIKRMQFAPYFLIMWDIVMFARSKHILVQGRGSAANSVVCYCLSITAVDPVAMDLLFERFICEGRDEPPDIDLDIAHQHREIVLQYVYDKYGREHAGMVCETITYRGRSAVRDAARVLGFSPEQTNRLAAAIHTEMQRDQEGDRALRQASVDTRVEPSQRMETNYSVVSGCEEQSRTERRYARLGKRSADQAAPTTGEQRLYGISKDTALALQTGGIQEAGLDIKDKRIKLLIDIVAGLNTLPRHRSIHVGGFVLSGEPLGKFVPIEPASMPGRTVIQWDKDDLGPMGMFKIDLLGLGMLSMIQEAMRLIKLHRGIDFDLAKLDMHDAEVFKMVEAADTIGIFQVESRAQMSILPKLRPTCFYDLVVSIALVRPGPIQGNIVHPYLRRRRGLEAITYPHPSLKPTLERTLGVPLFQEQGMRVAIIAGGFTAVEADQLRRVMSFKHGKEKMSEICIKLAAGMRKNGFAEEIITSLTSQLEAFANYGFPESHSASFALLAYASAYLKTHFAPEFYCAMLNAQPLGFYSPNTIIQDALRHNVKILPLDLAQSTWDCTLEPAISHEENEPFTVRLGLRHMQGLGNKSKQLLENTWSKDGTFTSAQDVCRRSQLGEQMTQSLAKAGAFASFIPERRQALWQILAINKRKDMPLFKNKSTSDFRQLTLDDLDTSGILPMTELEKTIADYQTQQLSVHTHIIQFYRPWAKNLGMRACADLKHGKNGEYITIAACVICRQRPGTAKGFMFFTLEDETGLANVVIKPSFLRRYQKILLEENFVAISGKLQIDENVINIIANHAKPLPPLPSTPASSLPSRDFH